MVAFHFPPIRGSTGFQRTLAFGKYLPDFGWEGTVLTADPKAYPLVRQEHDDLVAAHLSVIRAPALDTARHLAIRGRYLRLLAVPDRWQSWIAGGVYAGLRQIRTERPEALMSTYPIASAHVIGYLLHRLTGVPWIADLRDPMDQGTYPADPLVRASYRWIERKIFRHASRVLVTSPGTGRLYAERFGAAATERLRLIPNGYDPELFRPGDVNSSPSAAGDRRPLFLLHSGKIYPKERDPAPFLAAVGRLKQADPALAKRLKIVFRASGYDAMLAPLIERQNLGDVVQLAPSVPYRDALLEMQSADGLLVFQAANCDSQIPAKLYEYLYTGRPVIGITSPGGDTGQVLAGLGIKQVAALEDEQAIHGMLTEALRDLSAGAVSGADPGVVATMSRRYRTAELAAVLDELVTPVGQRLPAT